VTSRSVRPSPYWSELADHHVRPDDIVLPEIEAKGGSPDPSVDGIAASRRVAAGRRW